MYFNQTEVGQRVRDLRNSHGMTAEELSEKLDYSHSHVSKVESGQRCYSMDFLICLAQYFDVSLDYLVFGTSTICDKQNCSLYDDLIRVVREHQRPT